MVLKVLRWYMFVDVDQINLSRRLFGSILLLHLHFVDGQQDLNENEYRLEFTYVSYAPHRLYGFTHFQWSSETAAWRLRGLSK
jgi:hypothetical protein